MCGIAGVFRYAASGSVEEHLLRSMTDSMAHRGPDDEGFHLDPGGKVGLAFRRLAIVDLVGGHQPMSTPDGRLVPTMRPHIGCIFDIWAMCLIKRA